MKRSRKPLDWRIKLAIYLAGILVVVGMLATITRGQCVWAGDHWECTGSGGGAWQQPQSGARQILDVPGPAAGGAIAASPHPARCSVTMENGDRGSGTLVGKSLVITANHVVKDSRGNATVRFPDGTVARGGVVAVDPVYDLAAISLDTVPPIEPMLIDDSDRPSGELIAGGFGGDGVFRAVRGPVTGWVVYDNNTQLTPCPKIAGTVRPGDSGGAVVNESKAFVGVVWGCRDGETYLTCGRPLRTFLDRVFPNRSGRIIARNDQLGPPASPGRQPPTPSPEPSSPPISSTPAPVAPAAPEPTVDWTARLDAIDERLAVLEGSKQPKGEYLQPGDLNNYVTAEKLQQVRENLGTAFGAIEQRVSELSKQSPGLLQGLSYGKLAAGALGLSGPLGLAVIIAGGLAGRRAKQVIQDRGEGGPRSGTFPAAEPADDRASVRRRTRED